MEWWVKEEGLWRRPNQSAHSKTPRTPSSKGFMVVYHGDRAHVRAAIGGTCTGPDLWVGETLCCLKTGISFQSVSPYGKVISPSDVCNGILRPITATLPMDPLLGRDGTHSVTRVSGFPGDLAIGFVVPTSQYSPIRL